MVNGVLLDIAGVLYDGEQPIDGASGAITKLREAELTIRFITNSTRQPKRLILEKLAKFNIDAEETEVMTPAEAARAWLRRKGYSPHLLVHPNLTEDFADIPKGGQVAVVVGDAGHHFTLESLNDAFRHLMDGAPLIALAANRMFRDSDGELSLDAGAFVKALEYSSGVSALLLGKPSPDFFRAAASNMSLELSEVAMIGDDAESDISGALEAGVSIGILTRTGKFRSGDDTRFQPRPTFLAVDIAEAADIVLSHLT